MPEKDMLFKCFNTKGLLTFLITLGVILPGCNSSMDKPNIVFIMADDLGYGDLGSYGAEKIQTPNIDKIAGEGMIFTDAHSPASVCTPTRYAVLTGRYCWRSRLKKEVLWDGYNRSLIEPGRKTIGNMMKSKGYHTAQIGKWHLGWEDQEPVDYTKGYLGRGPEDLGFDYSFVTAAAHNLYPITFVENHKILAEEFKLIDYNIYDRDREIPQREIDWHKKMDLGPSVIDVNWQPDLVDSFYTVKAIHFIKEHVMKRGKEPFYLHLTPEAPHLPNNVPDFMKGSSQEGKRGDHIQMFDWMVGEIDRTLHELKIDKNTLLVITSDNGALQSDYEHKSNGILREKKGTRWEGGHRIPLIIKWEGHVEPGTKNDGLICLVDLMATFANIVGYSLEEGMGEDSHDMLPVITSKEKGIRETLVMYDYQGRFAIRKGYWKLVDDELYNLETDLEETNNVAAEFPDKVEELKALLKKQQDDGFTVMR